MDTQARCGCDVLFNQERKTILTQSFENPSSTKPLEELRYVFPFHEGVSVVSFTAYVGSQIIYGTVKEKSKATQAYRTAKNNGKVAGLLDQSLSAGDVFVINIGNVPPAEAITVDIEYLADLKHDAEDDALRFTIPTSIAPRYAPPEMIQPETTPVSKPTEVFSVTIDAEMPDGSAITSIQSPSHPISVQIVSLSGAPPKVKPSLSKASASLSLGTSELAADFVLQIAATKLGEPSAILETHPDIPNQRALMATLVPKFDIPIDRPEIVFICDRSASMGLARISNLQAALNVFLKALPLGVNFNLVSFGHRYESLWDRSQTYDQDMLDQAIAYVDSFAADFGGTAMYQPAAETFKRRYKDMNLEAFLLTDGEIWAQEKLFKLVNDAVLESKGAIRLFTVGIGRDASHALIEGVARAGNGFAQFVADNEQATTKFIRMLKASLTPHIFDYSMELKYQGASKDLEDQDFELIEKVATTLKFEVPEQNAKGPNKTISLFHPAPSDDKTDGSSGLDSSKEELEDKYAHLPNMVTPRYIQLPHRVPALFPYKRTTIYVLLSNTNQEQLPTSLLLKGTSAHGPLELEVPITILPDKTTMIHQLAARHTTREFEEGRGWIFQASNPESGNLLVEEFDGRFSDLVEREAVKLGVKYQVTGKWTSLVAEAADKSAGGLSLEQGVVDTGAAVRHRAMPARASMTGSFQRKSSKIEERCGFGGLCAAAGVIGGHEANDDSSDEDEGFALFDCDSPTPKPIAQMKPCPLQRLIKLQRFDGSWTWNEELTAVIGVGELQVSVVTKDIGAQNQVTAAYATVAVILYLQIKLPDEKDTWDMVVTKAEAWVAGKQGANTYKDLRQAIRSLFN